MHLPRGDSIFLFKCCTEMLGRRKAQFKGYFSDRSALFHQLLPRSVQPEISQPGKNRLTEQLLKPVFQLKLIDSCQPRQLRETGRIFYVPDQVITGKQEPFPVVLLPDATHLPAA